LTAKNQATVDGHDGLREQLQVTTQHDEATADISDAGAVVTPEVGNGLEVRRQASREPHHLDVALRLALQAAAGLNAVEVAVDVDLEQDRRMVRRATRHCRIGTLEAQVSQLEFFDERIDYAHRIVVTDVVIKAFGQQRDLATVFAFDESLQRLLRSDA
jgi:hypothetical protein